MSNNIDKQAIIEKIKNVKDPEMGIDLYTLGLIYNINIHDDGVEITMTLTSPFCPFADDLIASVEKEVGALLTDETQSVRVELTFDPIWKPSDELRTMLGM